MAQDWIKVEDTLPDKPEVVQMASLLDIDQDAVCGKLLRVWIWADHNSVSGNEIPVTSAFLDRLVCRPGFADAMREVGWLEGRDSRLSFPRFNRHNGQSAKARAETNRRVAQHRGKTQCNGKNVTYALQKPLPEKRREENINTDSLSIAHARPSLATLIAQGQTAGVPEEVVRAFFDACEARPYAPDGKWTGKDGQPIAKELSALMGFWRHWQQNAHQRQSGRRESRQPTKTSKYAAMLTPEPEE